MGEAQDLGPLLVWAESLIPVRDTSTDSVFQGRAIHKPIEEPQAQVQPTDQVATKSVNSSKVEAEQGEDEMVVRRTMTTYRFLPGAAVETNSG